MTKEQKADGLLLAAKSWQNEMAASGGPDFPLGYPDYVFLIIGSTPDGEGFSDSASAALSEVAALGFDIVDAETGR